MCVLAFAGGADPRWPVVLAGNRDERHDRATEPLHRWADAPQVLAGRDLAAGGTWLGASEHGRVVTVTNVRGALPDPARPSRGALVRDLLAGHGRFAGPAPEELAAFSPFNLVLLTREGAAFWSNTPRPAQAPLAPGVHGLGNGPLDEPAPRVERTRAALSAWLAGPADSLEPLFEALADDRPLTDASGGASAPVFLRNPRFGTRCSTVVRVAPDGGGEIVERRFDASGRPTGETALTFRWRPWP